MPYNFPILQFPTNLGNPNGDPDPPPFPPASIQWVYSTITMRFSIFLSYLVYLLYNSISIAYLVNLKTFKAANRWINLDSEVRQLTLSASSKDETTDGPIFNDILEQQFLELTVGQENEHGGMEKIFVGKVQALLVRKFDKKDIEDMWSGVAGSLMLVLIMINLL